MARTRPGRQLPLNPTRTTWTFAPSWTRCWPGTSAHYPVQATEIGHHAYDGRWPDLTDAGRAARLAWVTDASAQVEAVAPDALSRDDAIDRRILLENLAAIRFAEETLDEGSWNPMTYVYLFGNGLFSLLAREFAPLPDRMRSVAARLAGLPAALDQARATLDAGGSRPISALPHPEGGRADARPARPGRHRGPGGVGPGRRGAPGGGGGRRRGRAARPSTRSPTWLRDELQPRATGDFRLGPELYAQKFRHALKTDLTPDRAGGAGRIGLRRSPGPDAAPGPRAVADLDGRPADAGGRQPDGAQRAGRHRHRPSRRRRSCSTGAAPRTSGSRPSSPSATSSAWPTSRCRSSGRRSSCAPSAAPC